MYKKELTGDEIGTIIDQTPAENAGENKVVLLTRKTVAKLLKVSLVTLWRWDKKGYLPKIKLGGRVWYRADMVNRLMNGELITDFNEEDK